MGWHTISGEHLMHVLRRVAAGEDPDLVYIELYVNAEIVKVEAVDED
jgi:hypothetical protein